jgi:hypothetical protein
MGVDARPFALHLTLPPGDADFATRWAMMKRRVSILCGERYKCPEWITHQTQTLD